MADLSWGLGSLDLSDVCSSVTLRDEGGGSWVDSSYRVPSIDGARVDPKGPLAPMNLVLQLMLDEDYSTGMWMGLSAIKAELRKRSLVALTRTIPDGSTGLAQRAMVRQFAPLTRGPNHITYLLPLMVPSGSWQDASETSVASGSIVTLGDTSIHDPVLVFASAGTATYTETDGTVSSVTVASGPTFPVTVDVGAGTAIDNGSTDVRGYVTYTQPWGIRLEPGRSGGFSGTAVTVKYRNRWG